jgi:hypothetical protein
MEINTHDRKQKAYYKEQDLILLNDNCVICGAYVPEGTCVCEACIKRITDGSTKKTDARETEREYENLIEKSRSIK